MRPSPHPSTDASTGEARRRLVSLCAAALVVVAVAVAALSTPAQAGTYAVHMCRLPNGAASAMPQLTPFNNAAFTYYGGGCSTVGGDAWAGFDAGLSYPFGANAGWQYVAAPNTRIVALSGHWSATSGSNAPFGSPGATLSTDSTNVFMTCFRAYGCASVPASAFGISSIDAGSFTMMVVCGGGAGGTCPPGATAITLYDAIATTSESSFPLPSGLSGPLVASPGSVKNGTLAYAYNATDVGGGVYRTKILIDGSVVDAQRVDPSSSSCRDVYTGNASAYDFDRKQPCPLSVGVSGSLNTATVADGTHQLALQVEDVAGNTSTVFAATAFVFDNAPPTIADLSGQPGVKVDVAGVAREGEVLQAMLGSVSGQSPTIRYQWLRCQSDGSACVTIPGAGAATYTLTATDVDKTIRVQVSVTDQGGSTDATSPRVGPVVAKPIVAPPPSDGDGDGVPDSSDACPSQAGPASNGGCPVTAPPTPSDSDGDGVVDSSDGCPSVAGPVSNAGCPVVVVPRSGDGDGGSQAGCNPVCGGAYQSAVITGSSTTRRSKAGQGFAMTLQLRLPDGKPISGALLQIVEKVSRPGAREQVVGVVKTDSSGRASYRSNTRMVPSAVYSATYSARLPESTASAASTSYDAVFRVTHTVESRVTFASSPRRARNGSVLRLSGQVKATLFPKRGLAVRYEAQRAGGKGAGRARWTQFHATRTNKTGRFSAKYQLRGSNLPARLTMRACVEKDTGWPYQDACSRPYTIRTHR